jgi:nickel/cobalt exporter
MTAVALTLAYGAGSGALHAVTGPDHVLSLGPAALAAPRHAAFGIGWRWGLGHGLGTLLLALPLLALAGAAPVDAVAGLGERLGGAALLVMALLSARALRRPAAAAPEHRRPLLVGLFHGLTGAGALVLVLPAVVGASEAHGVAFLLAFALGGALAMGALTRFIARAGRNLRPASLARIQWSLVGAGAVLGLVLVVRAV